MKKNIKKIALLLAVATIGNFGLKAQSFDQGNKLLNVGVGIGSTLTSGSLKSTLPPIGIGFEYGFTDKISAGAYVGYSSASDDFGGGYKWNYSYTIIGARGSYHFANSDKLDPYFGATLGYNVVSVNLEKPAGGLDITAASASAILYSLHLGTRYYFTDNIGAFAELGYGIAFLQLGVAVKF